eukprot:TRINITY_DN12646_c0_g1_i3.p1 TRINITY_DN12646_c0_g1~~TRINITY_DN12646_c0_g1_i3.p1  ORF type:complete len:434 (-),score=25.43 TRINITY_DN12646_c0_g1_i3:404-1705(-)
MKTTIARSFKQSLQLTNNQSGKLVHNVKIRTRNLPLKNYPKKSGKTFFGIARASVSDENLSGESQEFQNPPRINHQIINQTTNQSNTEQENFDATSTTHSDESSQSDQSSDENEFENIDQIMKMQDDSDNNEKDTSSKTNEESISPEELVRQLEELTYKVQSGEIQLPTQQPQKKKKQKQKTSKQQAIHKVREYQQGEEFHELPEKVNYYQQVLTKDMLQKDPSNHRSGYLTIIGLPNVGKSTLMNKLLGQKLSIVTPKAQTTRKRVLGILSDDDYQVIMLDTPGVILNRRNELDKKMMAYVQRSMKICQASYLSGFLSKKLSARKFSCSTSRKFLMQPKLMFWSLKNDRGPARILQRFKQSVKNLVSVIYQSGNKVARCFNYQQVHGQKSRSFQKGQFTWNLRLKFKVIGGKIQRCYKITAIEVPRLILKSS